MIGRRRRIAGALTLATVLSGGALVEATAGSAAVQPARQHVIIEKLCPKNKLPVLIQLTNVTNDPSFSDDTKSYAPETLTVQIVTGGAPQTFDVVAPAGPSGVTSVVLAPGESVTVKVAGPPPVKWARVYQAQFTAKYKGSNRVMLSKNYCACQNDPAPTTSSTTSSTTTLPDP